MILPINQLIKASIEAGIESMNAIDKWKIEIETEDNSQLTLKITGAKGHCTLISPMFYLLDDIFKDTYYWLVTMYDTNTAMVEIRKTNSIYMKEKKENYTKILRQKLKKILEEDATTT